MLCLTKMKSKGLCGWCDRIKYKTMNGGKIMPLKYSEINKIGFTITKIDKHGNEYFVIAQTNFDAKNVKTIEDMYDDVRNWWDKTVDQYKEKFGKENWEEKLDSADYNVCVFVNDKQEKFRLDELL
jgi:hypothetical protein